MMQKRQHLAFWILCAFLAVFKETEARFRSVCVINGQVKGLVTFTQQFPNAPVHISGQIEGLTPGDHGFHIHEFGDLSNGCASTGSHYNPFRNTHGAPTDSIKHLGDLGNIVADNNGVAQISITNYDLRLCGKFTITGRGLVIHAGQDDLGRGGNEESKKTGNAGARLGCCIIGFGQPSRS